MSHLNDSNPFADSELSADDRRVLDALVEAGFERQALQTMGETDRRRGERLLRLLGMMGDYPVEDASDTLIHATIARIDRYEEQRAARLSFDAVQAERRRGFFFGRRIWVPDFISVAAVLLIGIGVLWPIMSEVRQRSVENACANNQRLIGYGFANYAADYSGVLPVARAGLGATWDRVSNNVNLEPLTDHGYCENGHFRCPGNRDHTRKSYAYQWQLPNNVYHWGQGRATVILGDRNPLIDAWLNHEMMPALTISLNHRGRGQNVLTNDGSIMWLEQPVIGRRDNIWLPRGHSVLKPGTSPDEPADVFLTQ